WDTGFGMAMDEKAYLYAIPYEYYDKYSIRRYGFHGTSHMFVSGEAIKFGGLDKEKAKKFGRFLQKVNIIKDVRNDFKENRIFWPKNLFNDDNIASYFQEETYKDKAIEILNKMVDNAMDDFEDTIKYIMEIEKKAVGYRHFCLIAALMAYKTLKTMYNNYNVFSGEHIKIAKKETMDIVAKAKANYYTNKKLEDLLETYLSEKDNKASKEDK
ncbi:squalene/phytoene synthase family protein, partial [Brachyspira pilosicoli]|uniref:squalene/phytoene synthase family protein n=1 Tax=Brachyspira pilosicoli TaxID=52584 RepID=UPI002666F339